MPSNASAKTSSCLAFRLTKGIASGKKLPTWKPTCKPWGRCGPCPTFRTGMAFPLIDWSGPHALVFLELLPHSPYQWRPSHEARRLVQFRLHQHLPGLHSHLTLLHCGSSTPGLLHSARCQPSIGGNPAEHPLLSPTTHCSTSAWGLQRLGLSHEAALLAPGPVLSRVGDRR